MNFVQKIENYLQGQRKSYAPRCNYAYNSGHPCARNLVYNRLNWQEKALTSTNSLLIFREGNLHEEAVIKLLLESGIRIIETQRPFEIPQIQLSGKIDGQILDEETGKKFPCEIKSMNPYDFEAINSLEDMKKSTKVWIRGYVTQMMIYLLGLNTESGIFILKNKVNGMLKFVLCPIDYEYAEKEFKKLELVNKHVSEGTYPDRIQDRTVCQYCDFKHLCLPDENSEAINFIDDTELLDLLDEREKLKESAKNYEAIDKKIKDRLESASEGVHLVGGKFQLKVQLVDRKFANVPEDIKKQFEETKTSTRVTITALK